MKPKGIILTQEETAIRWMSNYLPGQYAFTDINRGFVQVGGANKNTGVFLLSISKGVLSWQLALQFIANQILVFVWPWYSINPSGVYYTLAHQ